MAEDTSKPKAAAAKEPTAEQAKKLAADRSKRIRRTQGNQAPEAGKYFVVKNVVRRASSRLRRYSAAGRQRFRQQVAGRRLLRGQSMRLTAETMERFEKQIRDGIENGALELITPDGIRVFADASGKIIHRPLVIETEPKNVKVEPEAAPMVEDKPAETTLEPEPEPEVEETVPEPAPEPELEPEAVTEPDDLTTLPGIGAGRAKKLLAAEVTTYKQISAMKPADLAKIVGSPLTEDQASDICDAAAEMEG